MRSAAGTTSDSRTLTELPSYPVAATGRPSEEAVDAYERDGVVCLREAIPADWVDVVRRGMAIAQRNPDPLYAHDITRAEEPGRFFIDHFMWRRIECFERFFRESPAADLAKNLMRSVGVIFYFDFILIKEPGTHAKTPWHYDEAYWPISGNQMCNLWMVVDPIPADTALRFVRGSHRWKKNYRLMSFNPRTDYMDPPEAPPVPDWDIEPGGHEIVAAALSPGDCVIFHNRTHHSAPGNRLDSTPRRALATHWIGDDMLQQQAAQHRSAASGRARSRGQHGVQALPPGTLIPFEPSSPLPRTAGNGSGCGNRDDGQR